jgi:predicted hydrocarbon binding protein
MTLVVNVYSTRILAISKWLQNERKEALYNAGRLIAASEFHSVNKLSLEEALTQISAAYEHTGLGQLKIVEAGANRLILRLDNCATCINATNDGNTYCWIDAGFIAGGLENLLHEKYDVIETKCRGNGHDYCEFIIIIPKWKPLQQRKARGYKPFELMPI